MSNLENFNNIFANLAESAYNRRPLNFPIYVNSGNSELINYAENGMIKNKKGQITSITTGGTNLPNDGIVYLQPDKTLHAENVSTNIQIPNPNGGYHQESYVTSTYQKGLLTDEKVGFNAYFVTDTPQLGKETQKTYLTVRGSDRASLETLNDWVDNDANFALTNSYIPQARLANKALVEKIKDIQRYAPNATLDVTAHSLGTMVSAQAVAKLYHDDPNAFKTIDKVVLFDGADVTQSLKKMGLSDKEIKVVGEKVTYYVNPFDIVSMLNRTAPYDEQFGQVEVIVPVHFSTTFDPISSHDFGEFQMSATGEFLVASKDFHPELLTAGHQLANLIDQSILKIEAVGVTGISTATILAALSGGVNGLIGLGMTADQAKSIYKAFMKDYKTIVLEAKKKSKAWNTKHIPDYQQRIRTASGGRKIALRAELLQSVAQDAMMCSETFTNEVKRDVSEALADVQKEIMSGVRAAHNVAHYLTAWEVESLLTEFNIAQYWDNGIENQTLKAVTTYQIEMKAFSTTLLKVAQHIAQVDAQGAAGFNTLMNQTKINWGSRK